MGKASYVQKIVENATMDEFVLNKEQDKSSAIEEK